MKFVDKLAKHVRELKSCKMRGNDITPMLNGADIDAVTVAEIFQLSALLPNSARTPMTKNDLLNGKLENRVVAVHLNTEHVSKSLKTIENLKLIVQSEYFF